MLIIRSFGFNFRETWPLHIETNMEWDIRPRSPLGSGSPTSLTLRFTTFAKVPFLLFSFLKQKSRMLSALREYILYGVFLDKLSYSSEETAWKSCLQLFSGRRGHVSLRILRKKTLHLIDPESYIAKKNKNNLCNRSSLGKG